ncbi:MAG TPA: magnesium/cobalt transporter CorA [Acidimicrobiales bacterium]|nr:magnesium/cobalt transporter CorA [Acidimicrobiales bacterium]
MITARLYRGAEISDVDSNDISGSVPNSPDQVLWVDVADPTEEELQCLQEQFALHPLAIEDVVKRHQRPKLDGYGDHSFLVAHDTSGEEIDFFAAPNWLITVRESDDRGPAWSIDSGRSRFDQARPEQHTSGFLLYVLLDKIVDEYLETIDRWEDELEVLEEDVFTEGIRDERKMHQELFAQQRKMLGLRRSVSPLRDVLTRLHENRLEWIDDEAKTHLQDVYDHVQRAYDSLDSQREILSNIVSAHFAMVSNNMNRVMKKMTSWGAILLGSALVAGVYGMNFKHMPELDWQYGYVYALGLMVVIALLGYGYFKRKGWL